jgi:hypothetical protein
VIETTVILAFRQRAMNGDRLNADYGALASSCPHSAMTILALVFPDSEPKLWIFFTTSMAALDRSAKP